MVRNIVFDIGGVLADFRLKAFLAEGRSRDHERGAREWEEKAVTP